MWLRSDNWSLLDGQKLDSKSSRRQDQIADWQHSPYPAEKMLDWLKYLTKMWLKNQWSGDWGETAQWYPSNLTQSEYTQDKVGSIAGRRSELNMAASRSCSHGCCQSALRSP